MSVPSTPVLLTSGTAGSSTTVTSASVTPAAGSTVIAFFGQLDGTGNPAFTCTSTPAQTWTKVVQSVTATATRQNAVAWIARNVSGASFTVTLGSNHTINESTYFIVQLAGASGVTGATGFVNIATAPDLTNLDVALSVIPKVSSYIFAYATCDGDTAGAYSATPGSGYVTLGTISSTANATGATLEYTTNSASQTAGWTDVNSGTMAVFAGASVALEVMAGANFVASNLRPRPFAPGLAR